MSKWIKIVAIFAVLIVFASMATACREQEQKLGVAAPADPPEIESGREEEQNGAEIENEEPSVPEGSAPKPNESSPSDQQDPIDTKENKEDGNFDSTWPIGYYNPLSDTDKKINTGAKPSFNLDLTGFVKNGIKLKDLKERTISFICPGQEPSFVYKNENGVYVTEWDWFKALNDAYGLKVIYHKCRPDKALNKNLVSMNAGADLDIVYTHGGGFPKWLNLSQPLDPYINLQNIDNSPGVSIVTLKESKWSGTYRCIAPIGAVNVLWYNQTLVNQLNLADPHTLWRKGKWNWDAFKAFVSSAPSSVGEKPLYAYHQSASTMMNAWPLTGGLAPIRTDANTRFKEPPALLNNWADERVLSAWEFISDTANGIRCSTSSAKLYEDGTLLMAAMEKLQPFRDEQVYAKNVQYQWVPFPAAPNDDGRCVAIDSGYAHMIPRKVKSERDIVYAVKFMELWATRFTEAMLDYLAITECIAVNHAERKEYYDFLEKNTCVAFQMNDWDMLSDEGVAAKDNWLNALEASSASVRTESAKFMPFVQQAIDYCESYGLVE